MYAKALLDFGHKLGVDGAGFRESINECNLTQDLAAGSLATTSPDDFEKLVKVFKDALSLQVAVADDVALIEVEQGNITTPLAHALKTIQSRDPTLKLLLDMRIEKSALLKQLCLADLPCQAIVYIFLDKLVRVLQSPLPWLDQNLFGSADEPTVVVVSEADAYYEGAFLTIMGLQGVERFRATARPLGADIRARANKYREAVSDSLSWLGFRLQHITPLHLMCRQLEGQTCPIDGVLADHLIHLCILFTANRSSYNGQTFEATYASSEQTVTLSLLDGISVSDNSLLGRLALWPYGGRETDRLTTFQSVVARELQNGSLTENYESFVSLLPHLLTEVRWHYRVFLDGRINKHFEQAEKVTGYVTEASKGVSQAIDSVTKGVTDALLAAVGLVVVTLLASLVKETAQPIIVQVALWAYAIYLVMFQGLYRMGSILHSYSLLKKETDQRLSMYERALGQERVASLSSSLKKRERQFWTWFVLTSVIYLGIIIFFWVLSYQLPGYLTQLGVGSPTTTATPTVPPTAVPTP